MVPTPRSALQATYLYYRQRLFDDGPSFLGFPYRRPLLDLGCGTGREETPAGTGVDRDIVSLKRYGGNRIGGDVTSLPFAARSFRTVVCFHLVEHLSPGEFFRLFREISRVLRPGGHVFLKTPTPRNVWDTPSHVRPYPESAFRKLTQTGRRSEHGGAVPELSVQLAFRRTKVPVIFGRELRLANPLKMVLCNGLWTGLGRELFLVMRRSEAARDKETR